MQLTAGSLTGKFGSRTQYWAKRMLAEGMVHILATDAHNVKSRPPVMSEAFEVAVRELGLEEARNLVLTRPQAVLENLPANQVVPLPVRINLEEAPLVRWQKLFRRFIF